MDAPSSFLLFAGAGSGKTRTLVNVLQAVRDNELHRFIKAGQRIAVITYTNAACEEIKHRLQYDPIFAVSTIHSFVWELIQPFTSDIKKWLETDLRENIDKLQDKINRARDKSGQTAIKNARSRDSKLKRLERLDIVQSFVYSPTSTRLTIGSLTHTEVIKIATEFLSEQPLFQKVLVNKFPILLIDESQDTNKGLMDALIQTQQNHSGCFSLGLFGDLMQRIYSGGKEDLATNLPQNWKTPEKKTNYRSPKRVIRLINKIRHEDDGKQQAEKPDAEEGIVRLFIVQTPNENKSEIEVGIREQMKVITDDENWEDDSQVKTLTLEHAMAARRGEFDEFFTPLSTEDSLRDSLLNGTSSTFKFCTHQVLPLANVIRNEDDFEIMRIIKKYSHLIGKENEEFFAEPIALLASVDDGVSKVKTLLENDISLRELLSLIGKYQLLVIPDILNDLLLEDTVELEEEVELPPNQEAWDKALDARLSHVENYAKYVTDELGFATHQGVKGLEFDRVLAVIDDKDSKGFLFKYEKFFGAEDLTATDKRNEASGIDSVLSRTRRLFYVICSRAEKSLAVVAYSQDPLAVKNRAIDAEWFVEDEIILI
ncbi:UvrD-helicase domain-containing protein [Parashewanella curva]|uniref:UvrD-helicase domain-containing protein n=1 Tax=Parashewanella curva TaxID=2338552 RepID=UPI001FB4634A|nr:UvrD-helicase domain-containing protein [Parashewanella curva]